MESCHYCGKPIDKGACGEVYAVITINDDQANAIGKRKIYRHYLCGTCTIRFDNVTGYHRTGGKKHERV